MKKYKIQYIVNLALFLMGMVVLGSCTDWDEFKKYTKDGELVYSGRIDSVEILSGKERVMFKGQLNADPNIIRYKIFWNDYADSVEFSIDKGSGILPIEQTFAVDEGVKNFVAYTYDMDGNASVPINAVGASFGENYRRKLTNRFIESYTFNDDHTVINWGQMDPSLGPEYTELEYRDGEELKTIITPASEPQTVLDGLVTSTDIRYRTIFRPESTSIDTFAVPFQDEFIFVVPQLKNAQVPFVAATRDGRWGTLSGWISNDAVKIHNGQGGWDEWNGNIFNVESGWGAPAITNGKIYQVMDLDPGTYTFMIADLLNTNLTEQDQAYLVVAEGEGLPNVEEIDSSIGHVQIVEGKPVGELRVTFTIEEATQISLGYLTTQAGDTPGRFCNIRAFDFYMN